MKCFAHPKADAVGLCDHCRRGVCLDCAVPVGDVLACRDRCESAVGTHAALLRRVPSSSAYLASGIVLLATGVAAVLATSVWKASEAFLGAGIVMIWWSSVHLRLVWPWRRHR